MDCYSDFMQSTKVGFVGEIVSSCMVVPSALLDTRLTNELLCTVSSYVGIDILSTGLLLMLILTILVMCSIMVMLTQSIQSADNWVYEDDKTRGKSYTLVNRW